MKTASRLTPRMINAFCNLRVAPVLSPRETERLRLYLTRLLEERRFPPYLRQRIDCDEIAASCGLDAARLVEARAHIQPVFDALCRALADLPRSEPRTHPPQSDLVAGRKCAADRPAPLKLDGRKTTAVQREVKVADPQSRRRPGRPRKEPVETVETASAIPMRKRTGPPPKPVVEFPAPLWNDWREQSSFGKSLAMHMRRHGDSSAHLARAVSDDDLVLDRHALRKWMREDASPSSIQSLELLNRIERRYRLPKDYFRALLPHPSRAVRGQAMFETLNSERRRIAWHLPDDFMQRSLREQEEILAWVKRVIVTGATDYRRFQTAAMKQKFGIRFCSLQGRKPRSTKASRSAGGEIDRAGVLDAPPRLEKEMADLVRFKTSTLTAYGIQRNGVWNSETTAQKIEHLGLMFGALAAPTGSAVRGFGARLADLSLAHLIFPSIWDWYLLWREQRRGFYTAWEVDMLIIALSLVREETGWIRQTPKLAQHLTPIPGLVTEEEIEAAKADWNGACDIMFRHGRNRVREVGRVTRVHRDPFEPILPVLEAQSPVGEYRKITEEILRLMPDERCYPKAAAEAVRSFLMLRLGLHLGLRQKNLRELLVCPRDAIPSSERHLEDRKRGELRWSPRDQGWEVLIPSVAFKNATSSFFGSKPFRLILPNLGGLYDMIDAWIERHRARLIGPAADPGTFFVKTVKQTSTDAAYNQTTFYEAWRLTIQRYGIYNPYTGRGAIEGLLPHGPHNVRDVLATHILKQTGSYEQASYAIQDTPEMVAPHYGRFLPQDKSALAAQILNQVWAA